MAGIYIHIPFCKKACHYCNFYFSTSLKNKNELLNAILHEIELQKTYLQNQTIKTIYIGGGTPSILESEKIAQIIHQIKREFVLNKHIEITVEINPDDISIEKLKQYQQIGINRLSIGVQSFFEEDLNFMNRSHSAVQAIQCVEYAQQVGFKNISVDLIFGYPLLTMKKWKQNIQQVINLGVPHVSCYSLTVEPQTALQKMIAQKKMPPLHEEQSALQYELLMHKMQENGYEHYEISSFAKPHFRSTHNQNYWQNQMYLGIGPSAHSYNGKSRQWNIANNTLYIKSINQHLVPAEIEILTPQQLLNEYIMLSLRTKEGIVWERLSELSDELCIKKVIQKIDGFEKNEKLINNGITIQLTNQGKLIADKIAAELFIEQ